MALANRYQLVPKGRSPFSDGEHYGGMCILGFGDIPVQTFMDALMP
jgi:hypothetical protein